MLYDTLTRADNKTKPMKADLLVVGKKYGMLTVVKFMPSISMASSAGRPRKIRMVLCVCDCGNKKEARINNLKGGNTRSCGCQLNGHDVVYIKHGLTKSSEHTIWATIKSRCNNPNMTGYKEYGGRGIKICKEWESSFMTFYDDMGPRPSSKHSVERRNNEKGYCKDNCYWATHTEQTRNRRITYKVEYNGETIPLATLSEKLDIGYKFLYNRLINGWTIEEAIKYPKNVKIKAIRKYAKIN